MKKHQVTREETARFNKVRAEHSGEIFTRSEMKEILAEMGYPKYEKLLQLMATGENPPIIRVSFGKYSFNPKPVFIGRLQQVWSNKRQYESSTPKPSVSVAEAIKILKNSGYKVLKPVTEYEEL